MNNLQKLDVAVTNLAEDIVDEIAPHVHRLLIFLGLKKAPRPFSWVEFLDPERGAKALLALRGTVRAFNKPKVTDNIKPLPELTQTDIATASSTSTPYMTNNQIQLACAIMRYQGDRECGLDEMVHTASQYYSISREMCGFLILYVEEVKS